MKNWNKTKNIIKEIKKASNNNIIIKETYQHLLDSLNKKSEE